MRSPICTSITFLLEMPPTVLRPAFLPAVFFGIGTIRAYPPRRAQQVEGLVDDTAVRPAELPPQLVEIGCALAIERHGLAVENSRSCRQHLDRRRDRPEPGGPVIAVAGVDGGAPLCEMGLGAVAVPFDLMSPRLSSWRPFNFAGVEMPQETSLRRFARWGFAF
jgi:hypothetical protein